MMVFPVSISDLRLERIVGQPCDTAWMNFEFSFSIVWVMLSLVTSFCGSVSNHQREYPSSFNSGLNWFCHFSTSRLGGSHSSTSPASATRPSAKIIFQLAPGFHSDSWRMPNQYFWVNSGLVS